MGDTSTNLATASLTFSVLSFLLLIVVVVITFFPGIAAALKAASANAGGSGVMAGIKSVFALLGAFSPDIAILSGFISDIMNGSFRYSVTSFISIITVILHWVIAGLMYGFAKGASTGVPGAAATAAAVVSAVTGTNTNTTTEPTVTGLVSSAAPGVRLGTGGPGTEFTATGEAGLPTAAAPRASALTGTGVASSGIFGRGSRALAGLGPTIPGARPSRKVTLGGPGSSVSRPGGMAGGALNLPDINPCAIRGLGMFDISKSPMGIAALTSVFTVYLLDMYVGDKRSKTETGVFLLFSSVVYGLNLFAYKEFKCYGATYGEIAKATILPVVVGLVGGASGYAVLNTHYSSFLPLDGQSINSPASPGGMTGQCSAPNDKDQFVCDAYKDGKRISTSTVS